MDNNIVDIEDLREARLRAEVARRAAAVMARRPTGTRQEIAQALGRFALVIEGADDEHLLRLVACLVVMARHVCDHIGEVPEAPREPGPADHPAS